VAGDLVSVLIVSYNVRELLLETLACVHAATRHKVEAIIVDNASADGSAAAVEAAFPQAKLIRLSKNVGFGRANNAGLEACKGSSLLLLNPDVLLEPGCVDRLADFLAAHPEAGAVGPRLQRPDGRLDLAARRAFPAPAAALYRLSGLSRLFPDSPRFGRYNLGHLPADQLQEIDSGTAACLLVRRAAIDEVGFFDPDYFMYGEDLDLCYRIKEAGWRVYYLPDAVAVHVKGASTRQATGRMLYEFHRAMWLFYRKHYARRLPAPLNAMTWLLIWSRWALLALRARVTRNPVISP
jgi:GT2 family glycosyltransferase